MNKNWLVAGSLVLASIGGIVASSANAVDTGGQGPKIGVVDGEPQTRRGKLVHELVLRWAPYVQEAYKIDMGDWAKEMGSVFARVPLDNLQKAADARNFDAMNDALISGSAGKAGSVITPAALGDIGADLVFVPITPCRILDTRLAGGQIAANTVRGFDVTAVSNYSFQGGAANDCEGAGAAGSFGAAAINFTVVSPSGAGYMTAFPFGGTQPVAATVNYAAGDIRGNYAVVKLDQGAAANELSVYSFAQTHLVADIVGYYIHPQATQLDCVDVASAGVNVAANGVASFQTPNCPASYEITGGGCTSSTFDGKIVSSRSFDTGTTTQTHFCAVRNEGTSSSTFVAYGRCCRVPGR